MIASFLTECFNQNIKNSIFRNEINDADISPICKKSHHKSGYRPVSILSFLSKPLERSLFEQIPQI